MTKEFDLLVFVGRFSPFHLGHKRVIDIALEKSKNVLVLIGSAGKARTVRNPFTYSERFNMIFYAQKPEDQNRVIIEPLYDMTYNDTAWVKQVQTVTTKVALRIANNGGFALNGTNNVKIGLIGASKDHTSYYLKLFPQWGSVDVDVHNELHATAIRENYLSGNFEKWQIQDTLIPENVANFLFGTFDKTVDYQNLRYELEFVKDYKKKWESAPYPVKHVTVDAVVEQSGHILLVRRRAFPGKGLWALPGGHLNEYERIIDGMIRELREETGIKVPEAVLRGSIVNEKVFDDPHRSNIGRVITHGFHIKLPDNVTLPKVKGSDDADKAKFVPIGDLREDMLFDDHYHIMQNFLSIY